MPGWAAGKELRKEPIPLEALMEYLRSTERKNATPTAIAEKGEIVLGAVPAVQPRDIRAVTVGRTPAQKKRSRGQLGGSNAPRQQWEKGTRFYRKKIGQLKRFCKRMYNQRNWSNRTESSVGKA